MRVWLSCGFSYSLSLNVCTYEKQVIFWKRWQIACSAGLGWLGSLSSEFQANRNWKIRVQKLVGRNCINGQQWNEILKKRKKDALKLKIISSMKRSISDTAYVRNVQLQSLRSLYDSQFTSSKSKSIENTRLFPLKASNGFCYMSM